MTMTLAAHIAHYPRTAPGLVPAVVGVGRGALVVADDSLISQALALALSSCGVAARSATALPWRGSADREGSGAAVVVLGATAPATARRTVAALVGDGRRVAVVAASTTHPALAPCVEMGAEVIVSGESSLSDLATLVSELGRDEPVVSPVDLRSVADPRHPPAEALAVRRRLDRLSGREQEILSALMDGKRASAIARSHFVSLHTVRTQIRSLLGKLEVHSQVEAVAVAHRVGWMPASQRD